eukprot:CAMPEP_0197835590 /NCGR_PEP_ID=MMETSP1437-20131217/26312_1 /TAXON_ID=49252 ORGANISM="Eucampia antarctica, Strain CCMP1452" /NCGR_SAMPLE_ID=MMETSP1437 /ASSEMBLY_ACC=CAM_ASM_001096 /LENGTH=294 /DNA_ID=CAMNT_0043441155 /DNA_START=103 /DNA_END=987 /DNA_ORIENTATION=+
MKVYLPPILLLALLLVSPSCGLVVPSAWKRSSSLSHVGRYNSLASLGEKQSFFKLTASSMEEDDDTNNSKNNGDKMGDDDRSSSLEIDEEDSLVTKEMLMRDMLSDPKVKRKKKGGKGGNNKDTKYKVLDNRDALPFVVKVSTPDPYTSSNKMRQEARVNSKKEAEQKEKKKTSYNSKNSSKKKKRTNLVGIDGKDSIAASVRLRQTDGSFHKILGEFELDKNTNCGDLLEVGNREFEVQKAHCQYRYAGGKRFVMVRKILEVKEVTRIAEENYLKRQFAKDVIPDIDTPPQLE